MRRVVVTGLGAVTPLGLTAEESWESAREGRTGVGPITLFDATDFPYQTAAEVKGFDPSTVLDRREVRRQDRFEWLGNAAAKEALDHSGVVSDKLNLERVGVVISSGVGGMETLVEQTLVVTNEGPRRISPFAIPRIMTNGVAGTVSIAYGFQGPAFSVGSACASATDGIGIAAQFITAGLADVIVAGGSEASITPLGIGSFARIGAYSEYEDQTPRPFSADRDGLVMGEGAAVLILESLEHAQARGAEILAEIIGYGSSADAFHITAPTEDGSGSALAISRAIKSAGIDPSEIDYVNAHGTGTPLNDAAETRAVKLALGDHAYSVPMSSTKSMTGHIMGGTGALEAMFCVQSIRDGIIAPTINYHEPDPECDLDYVPTEARDAVVRTAISNSFGFGGHNAVLVLRALD